MMSTVEFACSFESRKNYKSESLYKTIMKIQASKTCLDDEFVFRLHYNIVVYSREPTFN